MGEETKYVFYQAETKYTLNAVENEDSIIEGGIFIKQAVQHYSRSIYTFWDFLGDVGGLYGILLELAYPILWASSLVFGSNLDKFLIESLFKLQKSVNPS